MQLKGLGFRVHYVGVHFSLGKGMLNGISSPSCSRASVDVQSTEQFALQHNYRICRV